MTILKMDDKSTKYEVEYFGSDNQHAMYKWNAKSFSPTFGEYYIYQHILTGSNSIVNFDKNGLRIDENTSGDPVLVIGDSNSAQDYLNFSDGWGGHIETITNRRIKIYNASVPSFGIRAQINRLKEIIPIVKPKVVILGWYLNDLTSCCVSRKFLPRLPLVNSVFIEELDRRFFWKMRGMYTTDGDLTQDELEQFKTKILNQSSFTSLSTNSQNLILNNFNDWGNAWSLDALAHYEEPIRELKDITIGANADFIVLLFPHKDQLDLQILDDYPQKYIANILSNHNIKFIDLIEALNKSKNKNNLFFDHCHLKQNASPIIGAEVVRLLQ